MSRECLLRGICFCFRFRKLKQFLPLIYRENLTLHAWEEYIYIYTDLSGNEFWHARYSSNINLIVWLSVTVNVLRQSICLLWHSAQSYCRQQIFRSVRLHVVTTVFWHMTPYSFVYYYYYYYYYYLLTNLLIYLLTSYLLTYFLLTYLLTYLLT